VVTRLIGSAKWQYRRLFADPRRETVREDRFGPSDGAWNGIPPFQGYHSRRLEAASCFTILKLTLQATNVLVNDAGNINICDFGLSQLKLDMKRKSKDKRDVSEKGTMRWLSPERMKGGPLTWKCDVYSFGMVIYEVSSIGVQRSSCRY
jgi:serine/threonine protein kinase